ncbi:type I-E CRISPR-associated protein Cas6/Cse3/CasE [Caballeronia glebae]|uniref:type I-E CRISPR-associated protein Cas6/Cse3/CasE n=1 Tax=Caballeronia glebae TaxID=1777143 RepID=UPI0038BB0F3F
MTTLMHCQPDARRLTAWAARRGYLSKHGDVSYALHAALCAAFGEHVPKPFSYRGDDQGLLAYSALTVDELQQHAAHAPPDAAAVLGLDPTAWSTGMSARRFPDQWKEGQGFSFEVRTRPIVRGSGRGRERDVFLKAVDQLPEGQHGTLSRDDVYREWLVKQFATGGAEVLNCQLTSFQLSEVIRQTQLADNQPRKVKGVMGPDVSFAGLLKVQDPDAFAKLIVRGIGRHRAFGFGMILVRPASI